MKKRIAALVLCLALVFAYILAVLVLRYAAGCGEGGVR